ncbi:ABC transporter ATP-binding protein [Streptomyces griseoaurantiacus]|uniref:Peptide/nickel transport system ATP-binding protein n=1 Tax=Streptomyces griseoaurantiacus TaxID=68213 RepID=A0A1G7W5C2_9ACTN|nr:ATP-binding cassette domain-containing protein [Streptomyces jietaisiensis]SDG66979.1 peptide/nickel transport system ATP-binding protein [Streptomyces jietaisiensis]
MNHMPDWYPDSQAATGKNAVRVSGLTVAARSGRLLLDRADLELAPGRVTAVVGPSGCGKTTLLRAVTGALPPDTERTTGTVTVLGQDPLALPAPALRTLRRHHLAYVGQDPGSGLNPRMSVRRLLAEVSANPSREAVRAQLAEVRLPVDGGLQDRRIGGLSGGQQRRVALARALARRPAVLLLDEPTAGLDPALRDAMAELLRHLAESHRIAIALSCHDTDLVARLADDVVHLTGPRPRKAPPVPRAGSGPARTPSDAPPTLTASGLHAAHTHRGRRVPVLHGIDIALAAGSSLGIVGASGSGKTTLLRTLVGLHRPSGGSVSLDGTGLAPAAHRRSREQRRRLQLVPQDPLGTLNPSRTVGTALRRPLLLHRRTGRAEAPARVLELLEQVGLPAAAADRHPHELSGGQRQRVSIARALAADPDVLFCDEVTSALDADTAVAVMDLLTDLRERRGLSLVLVSHDLRLVTDRTNAVIVMSEGHVVESGPTAQLFSSPTHPVTIALASGTAPGG